MCIQNHTEIHINQQQISNIHQWVKNHVFMLFGETLFGFAIDTVLSSMNEFWVFFQRLSANHPNTVWGDYEWNLTAIWLNVSRDNLRVNICWMHKMCVCVCAINCTPRLFCTTTITCDFIWASESSKSSPNWQSCVPNGLVVGLIWFLRCLKVRNIQQISVIVVVVLMCVCGQINILIY